MHTFFFSLLWKEWHEHKWKLASVTAILLGVTSLAMVFGSRDDKFGLAASMLVLCMTLLAVFVGLGTAASERSRGTLPFLQALPAPLWQAAVAKLLMGLVTVVAPVCFTAFSFYLWQRGLDALQIPYSTHELNEFATSHLSIGFFVALVATSLWIWSATAGLDRKDEISAGAMALAVIVGWSIAIAYLSSELQEAGLDSLGYALAGLAPSGFLTDIGAERRYLPIFVTTSVATHLALILWYLRRFGQTAATEVRSPKPARPILGPAEWLAPPRRSAATAIAWKQLRESGPIAAAGLAAILGTSFIVFVLDGSESRLAAIYAFVAAMLGLCVALVAGIGVALHDLTPQLNTFWRARPINPHLWFWMKYVSGLAVVLLMIYAPLMIMAAWGGESIWDPDAATMLPLLHIAAFAAAVAMTCFVRQPIYAAILSIAAIFAAIQIAWLALLTSARLGLTRFAPEHSAWAMEDGHVVIGGLLLCFAVSTVLAWLAMCYDWGRKSRY